MELIYILFVGAIILFISGLFYIKLGLQMQYLQLKQKKEVEPVSKFLLFEWADEKKRSLRWEAFLLFPMLYPIILDDDREDLLALKRQIKRSHVGIYLGIIIFIILSIYSEKVFPT